MRPFQFVFVFLFLQYDIACGQTQQDMNNLMTEIFTNRKYTNYIRPINDQSERLILYVDLFLNSVTKLDDVAEKLTTTGYLLVQWTDDFLKWNTSDYGGLEQLYLPQDKIWLPDLSLQNGFTAVKGMGDKVIQAWIFNTGDVWWKPSGVYETKCSMNIRYFPFDTQTCNIEFGNWMLTKDVIDVELGKKGINMDEFHNNGEWEILSSSGIALETDTALVRFTLTLRRKPLYHLVNVVLPVVFLSLLVNFTFVLPVESGEKMGYSVTVFLAFAVFLTIVNALLPRNSEMTPLISVYLMILLSIGTVIIMLTAFELRLHYRQSEVPWFYKAITQCSRKMRCQNNKSKKSKISPSMRNLGDVDVKKEYNEQFNDDNVNTEGDDITWADVTASLDFVFFWFFFVFILVSSVGILGYSYSQGKNLEEK